MPTEALTLILTPNNPCNTKLSDSNSGKVLYEVTTERGKDTITNVKRASDNQTVASWVRRNIRSDVITFGNASPMPSSAWLKKSLFPFRNTVTFKDSSKRTFKWKGYGPSLALELFSESDKNQPIARFLKPALILNEEGKLSGEWTPAKLILDERAEEIQDLVVVSFLMLERSRREAENSARIRTQISSYSITPTTGL